MNAEDRSIAIKAAIGGSAVTLLAIALIAIFGQVGDDNQPGGFEIRNREGQVSQGSSGGGFASAPVVRIERNADGSMRAQLASVDTSKASDPNASESGERRLTQELAIRIPKRITVEEDGKGKRVLNLGVAEDE